MSDLTFYLFFTFTLVFIISITFLISSVILRVIYIKYYLGREDRAVKDINGNIQFSNLKPTLWIIGIITFCLSIATLFIMTIGFGGFIMIYGLIISSVTIFFSIKLSYRILLNKVKDRLFYTSDI